MNTAAVDVTSSATEIITAATGTAQRPATILLQNQGSTVVYLGGADVSTSNGIQLKAEAALSLDLLAGETLYGITGGATQEVRYLLSGE